MIKLAFNCPKQRSKALSFFARKLSKTRSISGNYIDQWTLAKIFSEQYSGKLKASSRPIRVQSIPYFHDAWKTVYFPGLEMEMSQKGGKSES